MNPVKNTHPLPPIVAGHFTKIVANPKNKSTEWRSIVRVLNKGTETGNADEKNAKKITGLTVDWAKAKDNADVKNNADARKLAFLAKHINWIPSNKFLRETMTGFFLKVCDIVDFFSRKKNLPISKAT